MSLSTLMAILMFVAVIAALGLGYPVALTLAGVSLLFAFVGVLSGSFDASYLEALPNRLFGTMQNETLLAVPLFVFMGVMLERTGIAAALLRTMGEMFGRVRGGLAISVMLVGTILAASTGIVGATVTTMGLIALPTMLAAKYDPRIAAGTICAAGTLGQIIPPSVVLVLLGDQLGNAYSQAQLKLGVFSPKAVSSGDLFIGAIIPGLLLVLMYIAYLSLTAWRQPERMPALTREADIPISIRNIFVALAAPIILILAVLGSILTGVATATEAAAVGAFGAILMAVLTRRISLSMLRAVSHSTLHVTSMVFLILLCASLFSLVFRGFGGDDLIHHALAEIPGGKWGALIAVNAVIFLLGFVIDFIEIIFIVVPLTAPVLFALGIDPIWLGVLLGINLQTSFLTPPFGFALFYLRGVAPDSLNTAMIYRGVVPFIFIQFVLMVVLCCWPQLATWLPSLVYN